MPLLVDGQLIGQVDTKLHRADRRLELRHVRFEPWFTMGEAPPAAAWGAVTQKRGLTGLGDAAWPRTSFTGAQQVEVGRVTPGSMRAAVRKAINTPAVLSGVASE